jgi:hypothetical protein
MITFEVATANDYPTLAAWVEADPWHRHQGHAEWWLGANADLAFKTVDEEGVVYFGRIDREGDLARLNVQFAPEAVVSKKRVALGLLQSFQTVKRFYQDKGVKGFVMDSTSESLVAFVERMGFKASGGNDYRYDFEGNN